MDDTVRLEIDKLTELKQKLEDFEEAKYTSKITSYRGKIINKLKKIVAYLESKKEKTQEEIDALNRYNDELGEALFKHKIQLKSRYNEEFIHGHAKVPDVITTLPKGVALQVKKLANAINEIKNAKGAKAKTIAMTNFVKEAGLLAATPAIFAGKFAIEHWYLILLLFRGDIFKWIKNLLKGKGKDEPKNEPEKESPEQVNSPSTNNVPQTNNSPSGKPVPPIIPPIPKPNDGQTPEGGEVPGGEIPTGEKEPIPGVAINNDGEEVVNHTKEQISDILKTLQEKINNAKGDIQEKLKSLKNALEEVVRNNQNVTVNTPPATNGVEISENIFTIEQQKEYLYEYAKLAYGVDVSGNSYEVYRNIEDYALQNEMSVEEAKEWIRNLIFSNGNSTSIRFVVDDEFGLGYYKTENEFINTLTNNAGLRNVDLNSEDMKNYLSNIEEIGNSFNLIGTDYDSNPLLTEEIENIVNSFTAKYGSTGVALFIIYEIAQYGLACPTYGASLALPG
jgi:hypothetical protein